MIFVDDVYKTYRNAAAGEEVEALGGVSFRCQPGRIFALLGPNGSGKTTLLRILATLMRADEGRVEVAGYDAQTEGELVRKSVGFLTGAAGLHGKLTPRESLEYFGSLHGLKSKVLVRRIEELVERLDMSEFCQRPCGSLSMGQRQRTMIARTLIHDPSVVVFDEATTGLDVLAAAALTDMMRQCRDMGKTVLFSTHIMGEVAMLADDVTILHKGKQVFLGSMQQLREQQSEASLEEEFVSLLSKEEKV